MRASLTFGLLPLLASCAGPEPAPLDTSPAAPKAPSGEYCDGEDNDGDGVVDEGCTNCDMLYTRVRSWWLAAECVVEGGGTGRSLFPITVGSNTYSTWDTLGSFLNAPVTTDKGRLGQQILVGKLNAKAFGIGHIPYHDWDGDGDLETVDELLALADGVFVGPDASAQVAMFNVIVALNSEGNALPVYIDQHCARDAEYCDGIDNNGNGTVDESCGCVEICDGVDNDEDGAVDESGADNDRDGYECDDCDDARNRTHPGAYDVPENAIDDDCDGADAAYSYDFDTDIQAIFDASCVTCHSGPSPQQGLDLSAGVSYANIVGVASTELPSYVLVQPASPTQSYLYRKVAGTHTAVGGTGGRMPLGGPYLSIATLGVLGTWITEGAPPSCPDADGDGWSCTDCDDADPTVYPGAPEVRGDEIDQDCDDADDLYTYGLAEDIQPILTTYCTSCHGATVQQLGLRLDDGQTLANTVDVPAVQLPSMDRIEPGDHTRSYLYHKLAGSHRSVGGTGNRMPQGGPYFLAEVLDVFAVWIDEGAPGQACHDDDGDVYSCSDCDDEDPEVHPGAYDVPDDGIDQDCDGVDAHDGSDTDADGDGWPAWADCDDGDPAVYPLAPEAANGRDDDCDGAVDEGTVLADDDADGVSEVAGDCDDADPAVYPGAPETCDGIDQDCDGDVDEDPVDGDAAWTDDDLDGWGTGDPVYLCDPGDLALAPGDCDDADGGVYPGAPETCDGVDEDCDGVVDDGVAATTWYADGDGDGYGDPATVVTDCAPPVGYVAVGTDCDDGNAAVHPGATEVRGNGIDDDCDGTSLNYTYSFATNVQPIFTARCISCHAGASPPQGLDLSSGVSYANLVNVASGELPSMDRVEPGSTTTSYLYHKISGTQASVGGSGVRMPASGAALTAAQIATIGTWISEGAPNN